uniref:SFRICE_001424 n=1 Tax=Spodoptera frugiperda TaxID=7108 RepID=A0A2H1V4W4_SPOFR
MFFPYNWPLLTKGLFSHGEGLNINHHACSMRVGDFKVIIKNYKPTFPHDVFHHRTNIALNTKAMVQAPAKIQKVTAGPQAGNMYPKAAVTPKPKAHPMLTVKVELNPLQLSVNISPMKVLGMMPKPAKIR